MAVHRNEHTRLIVSAKVLQINFFLRNLGVKYTFNQDVFDRANIQKKPKKTSSKKNLKDKILGKEIFNNIIFF